MGGLGALLGADVPLGELERGGPVHPVEPRLQQLAELPDLDRRFPRVADRGSARVPSRTSFACVVANSVARSIPSSRASSSWRSCRISVVASVAQPGADLLEFLTDILAACTVTSLVARSIPWSRVSMISRKVASSRRSCSVVSLVGPGTGTHPPDGGPVRGSSAFAVTEGSPPFPATGAADGSAAPPNWVRQPPMRKMSGATAISPHRLPRPASGPSETACPGTWQTKACR